HKGCSIGANATILGGTTVGHHAIVGAGSVVTRDVPPHALVIGNPAKVVAWLDEQGAKLVENTPGNFFDKNGSKYSLEGIRLKKL
ncbi:MAG: DapH/DapD/GlmU-related protein, partial [Chitinophagaceae bacterium]